MYYEDRVENCIYCQTYWIFEYSRSRAVAEQPQEYQISTANHNSTSVPAGRNRSITNTQTQHSQPTAQKVRNSVSCSIAAVFIITILVPPSPITHCVGLVLVLFPPPRDVLRCEDEEYTYDSFILCFLVHSNNSDLLRIFVFSSFFSFRRNFHVFIYDYSLR